MNDLDRAAGIGGSDVPAILGLSPYRDRLDVWLEKTRHPAYRSKPVSPEMRFGTLLEPVLRAAYEEDTGRRVHSPPVQKTHWAADRIRFAHIDGLLEGQGIWEGKCPFQTWRNWGDGPPAYVHAQIQHYMAITEEPYCDVSALAAGLDPIFQTWRIDSDPETQANIEAAVLRFWHEHVLTGEPPDPLPVAIEFPRNKTDLLLVADEEAEAMVARLFNAREQDLKAFEAVEEELKEALQRRIGENYAGMVGNGWRIRYKNNRDSEKVEWKLVATGYRKMLEEVKHRLLTEQPEEVEQALRLLTDTPLDSIVSLYTETRPGQRPFVLERWEPK
jgi:putative phage-type endonuclease